MSTSSASRTALLLAILLCETPLIGKARQSTVSVTFNADIAPILFTRCASCHRAGGSAPFELDSYAAAKRRALQIADVTRTRVMPPWKTEAGFGGPFLDQHPLSANEIDRIRRWVDAGAPEGESGRLPRVPTWPSDWQLGKPDQVLTLDEPFMLPAGGGDVLRVFVLRIPGTRRRYVRGLEFRPGNPAVVHHANIRIDRTTRSRELDEADPAPGYDGLMANSAVYPDGHFLGWTPGQVAPLLPKGLAWTLDPTTDLVVELHLQPTGKLETIRPSFGLYYTDDPPDRTPAMLRLGRQDIDIPAGTSSYIVSDSYVLPVGVELEAVQPHAHYRAREIRGTAVLPDGSTRWLIFIKDWDFRWQHVYRLEKPFELPRGTTLRMEFSYDNSAANPRNPQRPPQRASWGQRSSDEMGNLWIQVQPKSERDLETLMRDFRRKAAADDAMGYEMMLRRDPLNVAYHNDVSLLYLELGQPARAVSHFETATELQPQSATAFFNLGTALLTAKRVDEAIASFRRAIAVTPDHLQARINLGNALAARGVFAEAIEHYRRALVLDARSSVVHNNLGRALSLTGRVRDAAQEYRRAIDLDDRYPDPRANLAELLSSTADQSIRDADAAVRLAERAVELTNHSDARALDVLSEAYAAVERFDRALDAVMEAIALAPDDSEAIARRDRAARYKQKRVLPKP